MVAETLPQSLLTKVADPDWVKQYSENRWLCLGDTSRIATTNLWAGRTRDEIENPHMFLLDLMRKPENFAFTCSILFNKYKRLAPFQGAIMKELWYRPFPMLIGSRGLGKCLNANTYVVTGDRICKIGDIVNKDITPQTPQHTPGLVMLGENGFKDVAYSWNNGTGPTKKIATRYGFEIEGTPNHPVRVVCDGEIVWRDMADVKSGDYVVIDRTPSWFKPSFELTDETAYFFGLMVGDGGYTVRGSLSFTTADEELATVITSASMKLWNKPFKKTAAKYQYLLCGVAIWDELFEKYGFVSSECGKKTFPKCILSGPKSSASNFIKGLMDTDGHANAVCCNIQYCSKSEDLVRTLQFVLTRFGIISRVKPRLNKKYNRTYYYLFISGQSVREYAKHIGFGLKRKQESLNQIIAKTSNENTDIIPRALILDKLLSVRKKWFDGDPAAGRWPDEERMKRDSTRRSELHREMLSRASQHRMKAYQTTYERLGIYLEALSDISDDQEYQFLKATYDRHLFFDKVVSVTDSECQTFDVHIPDDHSFISNGFISHNSYILAMYAMLRALFEQGRRIVIVGSAFRQAKVVFDYCHDLWNDSPIIRDIVGNSKAMGPKRDVDRCSMRLGDSLIVCLPMGDGQKIRGQRASIVLADEFASIGVDIFERVIRGFGAVSMNPVEKMDDEYSKIALQELGLWTENHEILSDGQLASNQTVISGTAFYAFNHFYDYWKRYRSFIETGNDPKKVSELFNGKPDPHFNAKDYCIIRMPAKCLPVGFMDAKQLAQARVTVNKGTYEMEYGAIFSADSNGFFKRSLIEGCVVGKPLHPIEQPSCGVVKFHAVLCGDVGRKYVIAVDPASEVDNFSIIILECWPEHRRIVHCWTTTRARFKAKAKKGLTAGEDDFYCYAARKIRELNHLFPAQRIAIDFQGGGVQIVEALQAKKNIKPGERPFLPTIVEGEPKDTDDQAGDHILEIIQFARAEWVATANHGMKHDFESKCLLFPEMNSAVIGMALEEDKASGRVVVDSEDRTVEKLYDTLDDCVMEIEELKDELATITHTQSGKNLRDQWDTPSVKQEGGKKGRLRKDRYSALLMANMVARQLAMALPPGEYAHLGGFAHELKGRTFADTTMPMYSGPEWFTQGIDQVYKSMKKLQRPS